MTEYEKNILNRFDILLGVTLSKKLPTFVAKLLLSPFNFLYAASPTIFSKPISCAPSPPYPPPNFNLAWSCSFIKNMM